MNPAKMIDNGRFLYRESQKPQIIKAGMEWPQINHSRKLSEPMASMFPRAQWSDKTKPS